MESGGFTNACNSSSQRSGTQASHPQTSAPLEQLLRSLYAPDVFAVHEDGSMANQRSLSIAELTV